MPLIVCHMPLILCHLPLLLCYIPLILCHIPLSLCHIPRILSYMPLILCHLPGVYLSTAAAAIYMACQLKCFVFNFFYFLPRVYLSTAAAAIYMACQLKVNSTDYRSYDQIAEWTGTNSQKYFYFFLIFLHQLRRTTAPGSRFLNGQGCE